MCIARYTCMQVCVFHGMNPEESFILSEVINEGNKLHNEYIIKGGQ